jgi:type IV secretory pathway VirB4 component
MTVALVMVVDLFTLSYFAKQNAERRFHIIILDEVWKMLQFEDFGRQLQAGGKFSRTLGIEYIYMCHNPTSIKRSSVAEAVMDLFADSAVKCVFRMSKETLSTVDPFTGRTNAELLGVDEHLIPVVAALDDRHFLCVMPRNQPVVVELYATEMEKAFCESSDLLQGNIEGFKRSIGGGDEE